MAILVMYSTSTYFHHSISVVCNVMQDYVTLYVTITQPTDISLLHILYYYPERQTMHLLLFVCLSEPGETQNNNTTVQRNDYYECHIQLLLR